METTENNLEHDKPLQDSTGVEGLSGSVATGITLMASAHSIGISLANSVSQQQNTFILGLSNLAKSNARVLKKRIKVRGAAIDQKLADSMRKFNRFKT